MIFKQHFIKFFFLATSLTHLLSILYINNYYYNKKNKFLLINKLRNNILLGV